MIMLRRQGGGSKTVLKIGCVCAGFCRDGHRGHKSLGRALHTLALNALDFILWKPMGLGARRGASQGK